MRGRAYTHRGTGREYLVLSCDARLKILRWWFGPFVVYRSGLNPTSIYIRTRSNFDKRFTEVPTLTERKT